MLRDGVLLTVVQQYEDLDHTLIFWNQHQTFGSEFSFSEDIAPIQFEQNDGGHLPASLFMKPYGPQGVAGYSFGIQVPDRWWKKVKESCPAPLAVDTNLLTGAVELTLAAIPLREFDIYLEPMNHSTDEYLLKTRPRIIRRRDELRQNLGWTETDLSIGMSGVGVRVPQHIEHRYFSIEHREI